MVQREHLLWLALGRCRVAFDRPARVAEGHVLELDLAADPPQLERTVAVLEVGAHVEQLEDLLQRRHPRLVGGIELGELLDRVEQVR